jgi:hypothetical protein
VDGIALVAEFLDAASSAHWSGHGSDDSRTYGYTSEEASATRPSLVAATWAARATEALTTLAAEGPPPPSVNDSEGLALAQAAKAILELTEQITIFTAALSGAFCCMPHNGESSSQLPSQRESTVLLIDIKGYRAHRHSHQGTDAVKHRNWATRGVELVAQWARAYGGVERPEIKGDEILMEFSQSADSAILAAASVLSHTSALRSMNIDAFTWQFHNGIDHGYIDVGEKSVMGECIDNASAFCKQGEVEANAVKLSEKAQQQCSADLSALPMSPLGRLPVGEDGDGKKFHIGVVAVNGVEVIAALAERLRRAAAEMEQAFPALPPVTEPLPFKLVDPQVEDQAEEPGSGV